MNKINCDIVKDLLPLYVEKLTSDGSNKLIEEHLSSCSECKQLYKQMKTSIETDQAQVYDKDINFLKKVKTKMIKDIAIGFTAVVIIFGILTWVFAIGTNAKSDDVTITTRIDKVNTNAENTVSTSIDGAYLNREWVVRLDITNGKALNVKMEPVYGEDENGKKIEIGYILTPYSVQPSFVEETKNYSIGYSHIGTEAPTTDFTVTVRFKDKVIVYSMTDEGLFELK